jgi:hypothetical protein
MVNSLANSALGEIEAAITAVQFRLQLVLDIRRLENAPAKHKEKCVAVGYCFERKT